MGIINEFPIKKNYLREKEVPGPRVALELKGEQGAHQPGMIGDNGQEAGSWEGWGSLIQ